MTFAPISIIKVLAKTLLLLLLLLVLAVGAGFVWLRGDQAPRILADSAGEMLAAQGLILNIDRIAGPLPGRLVASNLEVQDSQGALVKVHELELRLRLASLLSGTFEIESLRLDGPEIIRLPQSAPDDNPPSESGGIPVLPIDLLLGELSISRGLIHDTALPDVPMLEFAASARAGLAGDSLKAELTASLSEASLPDHGLRLELALDSPVFAASGQEAGPGDNLRLELDFSEAEGGFLHSLAGLPLQGLSLSLKGQGPVTDWRGDFDLKAATGAETGADHGEYALNSRASFLLRSAAGSLWRDLAFSPTHFAGQDAEIDLSGDLELRSNSSPYQVSYATHVRRQGPEIAVDALRIEGLDMLAELAGRLHSDTLAFSVQALLQAPDKAEWQKLAATLAGLENQADGSPPFGGNLRIEAGLNFAGLPAPGQPLPSRDAAPLAGGSLTFTADSLRWPTKQLEKMLGDKAIARLAISGGAGIPYRLSLEQCEAGIFSARGLFALSPGPGADAAEKMLSGNLEADIEANVNDLTALADAKGRLQARLRADGPVRAPKMTLALTSPELRLADGRRLRALSLESKADLELPDSGFKGHGTLALNLADSPGGALKLGTLWRAELPLANNIMEKAQPPLFALENLRLSGAGLELSGALSAALPVDSVPALNGSLKARVRDWAALGRLAGAGLSGREAHLDLALDATTTQQARLSLSLPALRVRSAGVRRGPPTVRLRDISLEASIGDLFGAPTVRGAFSSGPGKAAFLDWNTGTGQVKGVGGRGDFSLALRRAEGQTGKGRSGGQTGKDRTGRKDRAEILNLAGVYNLGVSAPSLRLDTLSLRDARTRSGLELRKPLNIGLAQGLEIADADIAFEPAGSLKAQAMFKPEGVRTTAALSALPFSFFKFFGISGLPDGELSANIDLESDQRGARGGFKLLTRMSATQTASGLGRDDELAQATQDDPDAKSADQTLPSVFELTLNGRLSGAGNALQLAGDGHFGSAAKSNGNKEGRLDFRLPLARNANGLPLPNMGAPLAASINWNGPVENLWQTVPLPDTYLSGPLFFEAKVQGALNAPKVAVKGYMAGGSFEDVANGLLIKGIDLEAANAPNGDVRLVLAAKDAQSGSLAAEADLGGFSDGSPVLRFRSQLEAFKPLHRDDLDISLSGYCGVNGPLDRVAVNGLIRVDHGEFIISSQLGASSVPLLEVRQKRRTESSDSQTKEAAPDKEDTEGEEESGPLGPALDLRVVVPGHFYIRGLGIDSEWSGDLSIKGHATAPSLLGSLSPVRGYMDFLARTFEFSGGDIRFDGGREINPILNLELTYENPDITAIIKAGGSAKKPVIGLDSKPPMPRDEILAHVLFGKKTSDLSRFEAIQLADSVRQLGGGGSATGFLGGIRKETGLDMLRLGGTQDSKQRGTSGMAGEGDLGVQADDAQDAALPALEAGKYINDSIYVGIEQGVGQDSTAVRVEVELFPSVTLEGKTATDASEVGVGWKMDY